MQTILIIEDDQKVAANLEKGLAEAGFHSLALHSGEDGLAALMESRPSAVLLDLNLPGRDGIQILQTVRKHFGSLPVLILSARDTVEDKVLGLETGADDYLVKPFDFSELLARLRVMLRREQQHKLTHQFQDLHMDIVNRKVTRGSGPIDLTPTEFDILELLMRSPGQIVSRQTIIREVWDQVQRATSLDNVIDVHIMRLRKKIGDQHLETVRGVGFILKP